MPYRSVPVFDPLRVIHASPTEAIGADLRQPIWKVADCSSPIDGIPGMHRRPSPCLPRWNHH